MATSTFQYPAVVSRTLDPDGRSLRTVVGLHDHELSDADVNLIQDLQDYKREQALENKSATSGSLTFAPMIFQSNVANTFYVPAFDVLFNGEVVTIQGFNSPDLTKNCVTLAQSQQPVFWTTGVTDEDARIYVVFLELWYQSLDPTTGQGYYLDPVTQLRYYYPYGCVSPYPTNAELMPDDSVDIFATTTSGTGLLTTERAQIQWRLNIQRLSLSYNFTKNQFGLDPDPSVTPNVVTGVTYNGAYGQGSYSTPIIDSAYQFTNMGTVNGDTGLWQAGDGNVNNSLGTMDGYTYAMPIAVMFQRNYGAFSLNSNIYGCGSSSVTGSGLLASGVSGRFDSKLADQIFADDVVDCRGTVTLDAWDLDKLMREGFVDVITGNARSAIGRGKSPGLNSEALGSTIDYYVSKAPATVTNTDTLVTSWDGFANGFSSDLRTFYTTLLVPPTMKSYWASSSTQGGPWMLGDAFSISLPGFSPGSIASIAVQSFNGSPTSATRNPINLLSGQITVTGLGSKTATVTFTSTLTGTAFDPGGNNIYCTVGVQYPANSGADLKNVPIAVDGGILTDTISGKTLPVYGVSEYDIQTKVLAPQAYIVNCYNPEYSNFIFGTRIWVLVPATSGTTVGTNTTFVIDRSNLNGNVNGFYPPRVWNAATGAAFTITSVSMKGNNCVVTVSGILASSVSLIMSFIAQDTAQLVYNGPVKGVTEIEETVLMGNYNTYVTDNTFQVDSRISVGQQSYSATTNLTTIVLAAGATPTNSTTLGPGCTIKGISGDDSSNRYIWVPDTSGNLNAIPCSTVSFNNGMVTITVQGNYAQTSGGAGTPTPFFFCGSILPGFSPTSSLTLVERYVPYQGEGTLSRNYEVLHNDDTALVTTNGTGAAPVVGLEDVYPYNREIPISTTLPAQSNWSDATLTNTPLASVFDSNYVAMRQNNVEDTFEVPLHTNDFIPPMNKDFRKEIEFVTPADGGRGFAQATPHVGFAIAPPTARTVLGQNLQSTTASIILYVNNVSGNDSNDGLSLTSPMQTITAALNALPPVLRNPCSIQLVSTNAPYSISALQNSLQEIALGDGVVRSAVYYALGNIAFTIQESGRLVITAAAGSVFPVTIDATGFTGFGNGPTSAFFVDNSRVIFNFLSFTGFTNPAIYGIDSDIDFVNCTWSGNVQAGGFEQGCNVIMDGGSITLPDSGVGMVVSSGELTSSNVNLAVSANANPGAFYIGERNSTLNLETHATDTVSETNILATTVVAQVEFNSSIVVTSDFQTNGSAVLSANSALARTVSTTPFLGGVTQDSSSNIVTLLS